MNKNALKSLIFFYIIFFIRTISFAQSPSDPGPDPIDSLKPKIEILSTINKPSNIYKKQKKIILKDGFSPAFADSKRTNTHENKDPEVRKKT